MRSLPDVAENADSICLYCCSIGDKSIPATSLSADSISAIADALASGSSFKASSWVCKYSVCVLKSPCRVDKLLL